MRDRNKLSGALHARTHAAAASVGQASALYSLRTTKWNILINAICEVNQCILSAS